MKCKLKYIVLFFTLLFFSYTTKAETTPKQIDSLIAVVKTKIHDTLKMDAYSVLINKYWKIDMKQALVFAKTNVSLALRYKNSRYLANAYHLMAGTYYFDGDYQNALLYNLKTLNVRLEEDKKNPSDALKKKIATAYNNIASLYLNLSNYPKCIEANLKALELREKIKDSLGIARSLTNIGNVYETISNYKMALEFQEKALEMMNHLDNQHGIGACYNNIGNIYLKEGNYIKARLAFEKAIDVRKKIEDEEGLHTSYNNIANLFFEQKKYPEAKKYLELAWSYFKDVSDPVFKTTLLVNLGEISRYMNDAAKGEEYFTQAIQIAQKNKLPDIEKQCYESLAKLFSKRKDFEKAYFYITKHNVINDTLFKIETSKKIAEMQVKYEDVYKSNQIESLKKEKMETELEASKKELELQKQRNFRNTLLIGLIVVIIFGFLLYNRYTLKSKLNEKLEKQNHEIAEKNNDITNSITYAKRIQEAILPSKKYVNKYLPNSFVLYKPKDIVAGDFFWFEHVNGISLIAAADCTGHGVPGALVSVVCSNALNRAVLEFGLTDTGKILDKTRELVLDTFSKSDEDVKDGMDISLCGIRYSSNNEVSIMWSGANNPLWYINNGEIKEIKAHKQPIGKTDNPEPFPTNQIRLNKGDTVYLFTDGYADQFGGEKGKKFKYKQLQELIFKNSPLPPEIQLQKLDETFETWRGPLEQVDDVCIIGIRL